MNILSFNDTIKQDSIITVGKFDGFHLGHQKLFDQLRCDKSLKSLIFIFCRECDRERIYTKNESIDILKDYDIDYVYFQDFYKEFIRTSREDFIVLLKKKYNMKSMVVGDDFRFGYKALGDVDYLKKIGRRFDFSLHIVESALYKGAKISSSRIRNTLLEGNVEAAAEMLGRHYSATNTVVHGKELGRTISFPTVNIFAEKIKPKNGVYATITNIDGKKYYSISNVGQRPTVESTGKINIETNIFDFSENIYGKIITVEFIKFIRGEFRFASKDELMCQICRDSEKVKNFFMKSDLQI